jgi:hypothetical protein
MMVSGNVREVIMEELFGVLFLLGAIIFYLATTDFFENMSTQTVTETAEVMNVRELLQENGFNDGGAPLETTEYYVTFHLPSTDKKMKFGVSKRLYRTFETGMVGEITYRGTWFKGFHQNEEEEETCA